MQIDLPHTLYQPHDANGDAAGYTPQPEDPAIELQRKANLRAQARRKGEYTTDQLFEK